MSTIDLRWLEESSLSVDDRELVRAGADAGYTSGLPVGHLAERRRSALTEVQSAFGSSVHVRHSPLGPEWSSDLDIHGRNDVSDEALASRGWLDLDPLLSRIGRQAVGRWAIATAEGVCGAADVCDVEAPDPRHSILDRAERETDVRSVLELRYLQREGVRLPATPGVGRSSRLERRLGGQELPPAGNGERGDGAGWTRRARRWVGRIRPRRKIRVAVSGVDGAGKSTLLDAFTTELSLAGLPHTRIWARPGYDLGWLDSIAVVTKRILGKQPEPGVRSVGADDAVAPPSRSGVAAALWKRLVVLEYVIKVRRRDRGADGLVVYDRHVIDAITTLGFAYGMDDLWVRRTLERVLPRPDLHIWLDIDAATAKERKPDDPMGQVAMAEQLERYRPLVDDSIDIVRLDAREPVDTLVAAIWSELLQRTRSTT